jgi:hypothetical protein
MKHIFLLFFIAVATLIATPKTYIVNHSGLMDDRAYTKINTIGNEVSKKVGVEIYLDVKGSNQIDPRLPREQRYKQVKELEEKLFNDVKNSTTKPFIILTMAIDQYYTNILYSNEKLKKTISKDEILDDYVIPLLASHDKNMRKSKVSAASLNGYAQIADELANSINIKLESSIGSSGKAVSEIWKVFMYTMVFIGIISYSIVVMREKKAKKND